MTRNLAQWLAYQERVNPHSIELGLERVREVWGRMGAPSPARRVITVAGTNGKGSTVALLESILRAANLRVASFTSPHLLRYNERVRVDGVDVDDTSLIGAFERIEVARHPGHGDEVMLTYFEFGTLAAMDLFARAGVDVAILEVGLGGRLDAVNIIDADVSIITTVDLDHMEWLGQDRDSIGYEKAGIARRGRTTIVGEKSPPDGLLEALAAIGAKVERAGIAFTTELTGDSWCWMHRDGTAMDLPRPALAAPVQYANAAAAIAALHALAGMDDMISPLQWFGAVRDGLLEVDLAGRLQSLGGGPRVFADVGHNPQAARALAEWLDAQAPVPVHAVYGALADKDVAGVLKALGPRVARWHLAGLDGDTSRGLDAATLAEILQQSLPGAVFDIHADVGGALRTARELTPRHGMVLAFGSFFVVSATLGAFSD